MAHIAQLGDARSPHTRPDHHEIVLPRSIFSVGGVAMNITDSPPAPAKLPLHPLGRTLLNDDDDEDQQFLLDYTEKEKRKNKQQVAGVEKESVGAVAHRGASGSTQSGNKTISAIPANAVSKDYLLEDQIRENVLALTMGDFNQINTALHDAYRFSRDPKTRPILLHEGGIEAILSLLISCKPNVKSIQLEYLEVVLGVLWNLMLNAENSGVDATVVATVSKECSSRLLLAILKPCTSRNKLVFLCCRIMEALMLHEPNATLVARLDGGLTTLLNIVHPRQDNRAFEAAAIEAGVIEEVERTPEAVEAALDLLAAFTRGSDNNVAALSKLSGFIKVSAVITDAMAFPGILRAAFNIFLSCSSSDKYASIIGRSTPAISAALTALKQYHALRHAKLQVCVLKVLVNLSGSSANLSVLFANKGSDVVMATMKKPGASPAVIKNCCLVLWKLFMHSQPPPFNLHEYDRVPLPIDYTLTSSTTFTDMYSLRSGRSAASKGSSAGKNNRNSETGGLTENIWSKLPQRTSGMVAIEEERAMQAAANLEKNINVAPNDSDNANKDSVNQFSTSNVSASLLTVGSNLGITGLNLNDDTGKAADKYGKAAGLPYGKKKAMSTTAFEVKMEEARLYPELAGRSFEPLDEADRKEDENGGEDQEMQAALAKYLKVDEWNVYKCIRRMIMDEFEDSVISIIKKKKDGASTEVNAPTKDFVIDHDAIPHALSKRPDLSQVERILKIVNDEMFLKVQVEHVERLVDRVKALNRIVYDVNKAPPFDMIKVFPDESLTSPGKRLDGAGESKVFDARRAARKRDMVRLGKLCDQAIAGQLRVAGTGKAAAAVAAARAAAAKSCNVDPNCSSMHDLQTSLKSIKVNGPSSLLDGDNDGSGNRRVNQLGGVIGNTNSPINNFLQFNGVPPLLFESRFECGNLYKAVQATETEYDLVIAPDVNNGSHTQWYFFSVFGLVPGVKYKFNFINLEKPDSMYNYGMQPLVFSERDAEDGTNSGWSRKGSDVCYYQNFFQRRAESKRLPYYTFTFSYVHHRPDDRVYFSYCYPYTYTNLLTHLRSLEVFERKGYITRSILCKTLAGNPVPLLTITNFSSTPEEIRSRRYIVVSARVHPGETPASFMMESVIDFLVGPSDIASWLRDRVVFKIVPMLNVDGVVVGNHRCNLAGLDLNRQWSSPTISQSPTIYHLKQMIETLAASSRDVLMYCDLHAHSRSKNIFMYGCENRRGLSERIIPYMLSCADPSFHFESCDFRVKKSKSNCGRVVVWRQFGLVNSYTMEASFCCAAQGPRKDCHFKPSCYESLGRAFCQTIARAIKKDQREVLEAGAALEAIFDKKARGYGVQVRPAAKVGNPGDWDEDVKSSANSILNGGKKAKQADSGKQKTGPNQHSSILVTSLPRHGKNAVSAKSRKTKSKKRRKRIAK